MRGRKPLPTAVKRLRGEKRACRLNPDEPKPPVGDPDCPKFLKGDARIEWNRMVPTLKKMGIFTTFDRSAFISYCEVFASARTYERLCQRVGPERAIEKGYRKALLADRAQLLKFAIEFGFTPSSRSRIKAPEPPPPGEPEGTTDSFEEFVSKGADDQQPDA